MSPNIQMTLTLLVLAVAALGYEAGVQRYEREGHAGLSVVGMILALVVVVAVIWSR